MGVETKDDYSGFDPKAFWSATNNEYVTGNAASKKEVVLLEKLISFLKIERNIPEIILHFKITRGECLRLFALMRQMKGVFFSQQKLKLYVSYKAVDFR